jgi:hypothetical protein
MLEIPSPVGASDELADRLRKALETISARPVTHLVEQKFLDCHSEARMRELQASPLTLPIELQHRDRRELDLLVFELLGVPGRQRREALVDRLYAETALYYREQRVQDIQSTIDRAKRTGGQVGQFELASDAWNELEAEWQEPLGTWLHKQAGRARTVSLPEGEVRLPRAENWFEATTIYFGKKPATSHVCASRAEAELLATVARAGVRGPISVPATEEECRQLCQQAEARVALARAKFDDLAAQRAGSDKLREQVADLLYRWFIHGHPQ